MKLNLFGRLHKIFWGAEKAEDILNSINPRSSCQEEINALINLVDAKLKADEKATWELKMKQYADKITIKKSICVLKKKKREQVRNM